jgi:hypothetical protein
MNYIYHSEVLALRNTLKKFRTSPDIINRWPFRPWSRKVSPFRVYLDVCNKSCAQVTPVFCIGSILSCVPMEKYYDKVNSLNLNDNPESVTWSIWKSARIATNLIISGWRKASQALITNGAKLFFKNKIMWQMFQKWWLGKIRPATLWQGVQSLLAFHPHKTSISLAV